MNILPFKKQYEKEIAKWQRKELDLMIDAQTVSSRLDFLKYLLDEILKALEIDIYNDKGKIDFIKIIFGLGKIVAKIKLLIDKWRLYKTEQK